MNARIVSSHLLYFVRALHVCTDNLCSIVCVCVRYGALFVQEKQVYFSLHHCSSIRLYAPQKVLYSSLIKLLNLNDENIHVHLLLVTSETQRIYSNKNLLLLSHAMDSSGTSLALSHSPRAHSYLQAVKCCVEILPEGNEHRCVSIAQWPTTNTHCSEMRARVVKNFAQAKAKIRRHQSMPSRNNL